MAYGPVPRAPDPYGRPRPPRPRPASARPTAHPGRPPIDPYAALFGSALNERQIQRRTHAEAQAQIKPLLDQIAAELNKRSAAEQAHLGAATKSYAQLAGAYGPAVKNAYGAAQQGQ